MHEFQNLHSSIHIPRLGGVLIASLTLTEMASMADGAVGNKDFVVFDFGFAPLKTGRGANSEQIITSPSRGRQRVGVKSA